MAVGHVGLRVTDVAGAARWFQAVGLRPVVGGRDFAVLELRGGTHLVVTKAERPPKKGTRAPFDLMVDDIEAAHREYAAKTLAPSPIRRGSIHDSFRLEGPDGYAVAVVSSHVGDRVV